MMRFTSALRRAAPSLALASGTGVVGGLVGSAAFASEEEHGLAPANYPWSNEGMMSSFDAAGIRRGYQVYRGVCATCHSLNRIAFRNMDGVAYSSEELKLMAAEIEYEEPPDEEGNVEMRPGKPFDYMPSPYSSDAAARAANAGALPPDLSLIVKARHNGANYVFSLLTGFIDPPEFVELAEGQHYNPYFPGGKIGMARPLQDGQVEYDCGTPASTSQMAKDVTIFLNWAAEPEHDDRKKMGIKWMIALTAMAIGSGYMKRFRWSLYKGRKIEFR